MTEMTHSELGRLTRQGALFKNVFNFSSCVCSIRYIASCCWASPEQKEEEEEEKERDGEGVGEDNEGDDDDKEEERTKKTKKKSIKAGNWQLKKLCR